MKRSIALAGALVAACSSATEPLRLDYPPASGRASLVLAVKQGSLRTVRAIALDRTPPVLVLPLAEAPGDVALEGALYAKPLSELGLTAGELAPTGAEGSVLPPPSEVFTASVQIGDAATAWAPRAGFSDELAAFRTTIAPTAVDPCTPFTIRTFQVPPPGIAVSDCRTGSSTIAPPMVLATAALTATSAIFTTIAGEFFEAGESGVRRLSMPAGTPFRTMSRDGRGRVWLADDGKLAWLEGGLTPHVMVVPRVGSIFVDLASTQSATGEVELYAATALRGLLRWEGTSWRAVWREGTMELAQRLAWIGPGEVVAATSLATLARYRCTGDPCASHERVTHEPVGLGAQVTMVSVGHVEGLGTFAGGSLGQFVRYDPQSAAWAPYPAPGLPSLSNGELLTFRGHLLVGSLRGYVSEVSPAGICAARQVVTGNITRIAALGTRRLFVGTSSEEGGTTCTLAAWLTAPEP